MPEPTETQPLAGRTVLFLVTEAAYFLSHRLPLGRAARDRGARVVVACRLGPHRQTLEAEGFEAADIPFNRSGRNPLEDLRTLRAIIALYRRAEPDLVHHVAMKPVLYGSIAAWRCGVPAAVNALGGLGFLFISQGPGARALRAIISAAFGRLLNRYNSVLIVQNGDDRAVFEGIGVRPGRIRVIRGAGVDTGQFRPSPEPDGPPVALCVSRLLRDKGIGELVAAARLLKAKRHPLKVRLVGGVDDNPASFSAAEVEGWAEQGVVECAGPRDDIAAEYAACHIAVLPSYREGLPKSLLEAAACGRPMVATDVPGCREVCRDGETGLLVPPRSVEPLAEALQRLADDAALRAEYGAAARKAAEREFAEEIVIESTMALYSEMLSRHAATAGKARGA